MTDQQNFKSLYGSHRAITPNLDKFRQNAIFFQQSYCTSPHCCPSRASFFSGLYPSQHGVWNNVEVDNALSRGLFDDVILFTERLQQSGYRTLFSGKWHVSAYESPTDRCCFSKRMRKLFIKNEKSVLRFCNKSSKTKRAFTKVLMPCKRPF